MTATGRGAPGPPDGPATRYFCGVRTETEPSDAPPADYEAAGELLRALAAPLRIAIVMELAEGPKYVHQIVETLAVTQPLVSQHLRVLRGAGIVRGTRSGREISYSLIDDHIAHIVTDAVYHAREER
ncbi:winged helix-turn-helix transcriptional regulator [Glycomyces paridis]|uniref:Winged helix-turn-helix transcriptional regulator n=1 Tax=Glycomyces paridis TaxID=2126555 RepID=A0A4S8PKZ4_9ACTN|nr:winged helix-turn-helix transcriptional regulator [Glycomyces paridis]